MIRWYALDGDLTFGGYGSDSKGARFEVIAGDGVLGALEVFGSSDGEEIRANAFNFCAHFVEEVAEVLDVRFAGGEAEIG